MLYCTYIVLFLPLKHLLLTIRHHVVALSFNKKKLMFKFFHTVSNITLHNNIFKVLKCLYLTTFVITIQVSICSAVLLVLMGTVSCLFRMVPTWRSSCSIKAIR